MCSRVGQPPEKRVTGRIEGCLGARLGRGRGRGGGGGGGGAGSGAEAAAGLLPRGAPLCHRHALRLHAGPQPLLKVPVTCRVPTASTRINEYLVRSAQRQLPLARQVCIASFYNKTKHACKLQSFGRNGETPEMQPGYELAGAMTRRAVLTLQDGQQHPVCRRPWSTEAAPRAYTPLLAGMSRGGLCLPVAAPSRGRSRCASEACTALPCRRQAGSRAGRGPGRGGTAHGLAPGRLGHLALLLLQLRDRLGLRLPPKCPQQHLHASMTTLRQRHMR